MPQALHLLLQLYLSFWNFTIALEVGIINLSPFYRWANWGLERLSHLSMFIQLRIRTLTWFCYSANWLFLLYLPLCSFLFLSPSHFLSPSIFYSFLCGMPGTVHWAGDSKISKTCSEPLRSWQCKLTICNAWDNVRTQLVRKGTK